MKWVVIASFIMYLATFSEGNALRCLRDTKNGCLIGNADKVEKSHAECLSGTEWESSCHRCRCSDLGHAKCTLLDTCEKGEYEEHMVCKPNTTFHRDCNICRCLENGKGSYCTEKACLDFVQTVQPSDLQHGLDCLPGSRWVSQCNNCTCSPDGYPTCTERLCPGQENEISFSCAPYTSWKIECNSCSCTPNGRAYCTRMGCHMFEVTDFTPKVDEAGKKEENVTLTRKTRATPQGTLKSCQPGQEFRMDCNKCLCNNEGQDYSCTRIDCAALNSNSNSGARTKREVATQLKTNCEPGTVFNQDCNTCRCTEDGNHATCTVKRCKEDKPDENELNLPESDPNFRCNPGEQFKKDCNDCTCSADGKSVFCTLRLCDVDLSTTI